MFQCEKIAPHHRVFSKYHETKHGFVITGGTGRDAKSTLVFYFMFGTRSGLWIYSDTIKHFNLAAILFPWFADISIANNFVSTI